MYAGLPTGEESRGLRDIMNQYLKSGDDDDDNDGDDDDNDGDDDDDDDEAKTRFHVRLCCPGPSQDCLLAGLYALKLNSNQRDKKWSIVLFLP